jgi:hypothetical protein
MLMPRVRRQIVRDVSDEDGLVGKFQANVHEVGAAGYALGSSVSRH